MLFNKEDAPANVVKVYPQASDLFNQYNINFCCEGEQTLEVQCYQLNISVQKVLDELNERYAIWRRDGNTTYNWDNISLNQLVEHIIEHHHAYLKKELTALNHYVTRVSYVHGGRQPHLMELYSLYEQLIERVEMHIQEEEKVLFPLIEQYAAGPNKKLLAQFEQIHYDLENNHYVMNDLFKQMNEVTNNFIAPIDACGTYQVAYDRLVELELSIRQYIHLERNIFLKRVNLSTVH